MYTHTGCSNKTHTQTHTHTEGTELTVKKGCFVSWSTLFSVRVCAISSLATITSFLSIFMAMISPVSLSRHITTWERRGRGGRRTGGKKGGRRERRTGGKKGVRRERRKGGGEEGKDEGKKGRKCTSNFGDTTQFHSSLPSQTSPFPALSAFQSPPFSVDTAEKSHTHTHTHTHTGTSCTNLGRGFVHSILHFLRT